MILANPEDASAVCPWTWTHSTGTFLLYVSERGGPPVDSFRLREERHRGPRHPCLGPAGVQGRARRGRQEGERGASCDCVVVGSGLSSDPAFRSQRRGAAPI